MRPLVNRRSQGRLQIFFDILLHYCTQLFNFVMQDVRILSKDLQYFLSCLILHMLLNLEWVVARQHRWLQHRLAILADVECQNSWIDNLPVEVFPESLQDIFQAVLSIQGPFKFPQVLQQFLIFYDGLIQLMVEPYFVVVRQHGLSQALMELSKTTDFHIVQTVIRWPMARLRKLAFSCKAIKHLLEICLC